MDPAEEHIFEVSEEPGGPEENITFEVTEDQVTEAQIANDQMLDENREDTEEKAVPMTITVLPEQHMDEPTANQLYKLLIRSYIEGGNKIVDSYNSTNALLYGYIM